LHLVPVPGCAGGCGCEQVSSFASNLLALLPIFQGRLLLSRSIPAVRSWVRLLLLELCNLCSVSRLIIDATVWCEIRRTIAFYFTWCFTLHTNPCCHLNPSRNCQHTYTYHIPGSWVRLLLLCNHVIKQMWDVSFNDGLCLFCGFCFFLIEAHADYFVFCHLNPSRIAASVRGADACILLGSPWLAQEIRAHSHLLPVMSWMHRPVNECSVFVHIEFICFCRLYKAGDANIIRSMFVPVCGILSFYLHAFAPGGFNKPLHLQNDLSPHFRIPNPPHDKQTDENMSMHSSGTSNVLFLLILVNLVISFMLLSCLLWLCFI
jgi:hypothetical protein